MKLRKEAVMRSLFLSLVLVLLLALPALCESPLRWENGLGYRYPQKLVKTSATSWEATTGSTKFSLISSSGGTSVTSAKALLSKLARQSGWKASPYQTLLLGSPEVWRLDYPGGAAVCFKNSVLKSYNVVLVSTKGGAGGKEELRALLLSLRNDPISWAKNKAAAAQSVDGAKWFEVRGPKGTWTLRMPGSQPKFQDSHAPYYACEITSYYPAHSALFKVREIPKTNIQHMKKWRMKFETERGQKLVWLNTGRSDRFQCRADNTVTTHRSYVSYVQLPGNAVLEVIVSGFLKDNFRASPQMEKLLDSIRAH